MTTDEARVVFNHYFSDDDLERVRRLLINAEVDAFVDGNNRETILQIVFDWINDGLPEFPRDREGVFMRAFDAVSVTGDAVDEEEWMKFVDELRED